MVGQTDPAPQAGSTEVRPTARRGVFHLLAHTQELGALELNLLCLTGAGPTNKEDQPMEKIKRALEVHISTDDTARSSSMEKIMKQSRVCGVQTSYP